MAKDVDNARISLQRQQQIPATPIFGAIPLVRVDDRRQSYAFRTSIEQTWPTDGGWTVPVNCEPPHTLQRYQRFAFYLSLSKNYDTCHLAASISEREPSREILKRSISTEGKNRRDLNIHERRSGQSNCAATIPLNPDHKLSPPHNKISRFADFPDPFVDLVVAAPLSFQYL